VTVPKRHLGQHFLSDPRILGRIADALLAAPGDRVLEIGPGRGGLTRALLERRVSLTAIERDADLVPGLRSAFPELTVIEGDALAVDWPAAVGAGPADSWLVAGNVPYNITTPLLEKALTPPLPTRIVFLIQREVADRLAAGPGTAEYGGLTVGVGAAARVERLFTVAPGAFQPRPAVDSAVVRITPRESPLVAPADVLPFRRLVTALFGARRKQLARALRTVTGLDDNGARAMLESLGLDPIRRPEVLSIDEFVALYRRLVDAGGGGRVAL
jgi:16S rRNA (adenine1518-N6/adenine1519-N6)-dimethyltransferase